MKSVESKFPILLRASLWMSFLTFIVAFPLSVLVELYISFGYIDKQAGYGQLRLGMLGLTVIIGVLNVLINHNHWLKLFPLQAYAFFFIYLVIVLLLHSDEVGYKRDDLLTSNEYFVPIFFSYAAYSVLGLYLVRFYVFRHVLLVILVMGGLVVLQFSNFETYRLDVENYVDDANVGNYQFIGDAFAITSLLLIAFYRSILIRALLYFCSLFVLFFIGSRTSFAVYGLAGGMFFIFTVPFYFWIGSVVVVALSMTVYVDTIILDGLESKNERMIGIFVDFEDDGSIIGRGERSDHGWEDILQHPIAGEFGGQRDFGDWNAYMHNFFSYWRQFGIVPFLVLCSLYFLFIILCVGRKNKYFSVYYSVPFVVGIFLLVESLISRSYFFGRLHVFFGLLIAFQAWNKYGESYINYGGNSGTLRKRRRRRRVRKNSAKT